MIRYFESVAALGDYAQQVCPTMPYFGDLTFFGPETKEQVFRRAETGDDSLVPEAERLLDQLETQIEVPKRIWDRAPVGAYYVVPDVLAGLPTPARRLREIGDEHSPIAILACSTISAGITTDTIKKRGITILALVLALSRIRPISLHTVATTGAENGDHDETVLCTRIETAPLHLASACWALTSTGFARRLNYNIAAKINGFVGMWPVKYYQLGSAKYCEYLGEVLSPTDQRNTLVIAPTHLRDPLANNPVPWLNEQIKRFVGEQE